MAKDYSDAETQIKEIYYQQAVKLKNEGKYDEAYSVFQKIKGYKDVDVLLEDTNIAESKRKAEYERVRTTGNSVFFGHYEQDDDSENGKEEIEWIVLDVQGNNALLISKYILFTLPFHSVEKAGITWEECDLRGWLNTRFLEDAFSVEEQAGIQLTVVQNDKYEGHYGCNKGNNTQDKVFLLSYDEAKRFFASNDDRLSTMTAYSFTRYSQKRYSSIDEYHSWLLRTTCGKLVYEAGGALDIYQDDDGFLIGGVTGDYNSVRPVIVVDIDALVGGSNGSQTNQTQDEQTQEDQSYMDEI